MSARPLPLPSTRPAKLPYNVAFREIVSHVKSALEAAGEQWSDAERQAAACTLFIQAAKDGFLMIWERPSPPVESDDARRALPPFPPSPDPHAGNAGAVPSHLERALSASIDLARAGKPFRPSPPVAPMSAATPIPPSGATRKIPPIWFQTMLEAFKTYEVELPPEVYSSVLQWHRVESPEDFTPEREAEALQCYAMMKRALADYRERMAPRG